MPKGQYKRPSFEDRLPQITEKNDKGCLLYTGHLDRYGYGQISIAGKNETMHRMMWKHHHGEIPEGMYIGHSCDEKYPKESIENRRCCEITHLYLTTPLENTQRMYNLGRHEGITPGSIKPGESIGELNKNAKLNWEKVREIRAKIAVGLPYGGLKKLAAEYGIQYITAQKIKANQLWKLETDPLQK